MGYFLTILILASLAALVIQSRTRSARLAHLAKLNGCAFVKEKETVTTPLSAGKLEFFTQFFHQFQNVFTYSDPMAYIRIADDSLYTDPKPTTKPQHITIFTAELRDSQFPTLKAAPLSSRLAPSQHALMKTNIPAVDSRYRLHAPTPASALLLTPFITGLLKTKNNMYLELNDNALIYHEHTLIAPEEMDAFRFRAMQILSEFENFVTRFNTQEQPQNTAAVQEVNEAEQRAQAMLKALCTHKQPAVKQGSRYSVVWIFILLAVLTAMTFLSWFLLNRMTR